ncbi:hypothetical protein [Alkaliphilus oremlandii]|uniref:hypothetical protein n=1 Tax=Alkaliphilus oremlandii TaxID=461876 RepID=UPI0012E9DEFD|nr:hypothetical protein [Alkaliphilus oremlandii]
MKKHDFPTKEEFRKTIMRLRKEKIMKHEGIYLGYLKEQRMQKKPRRLKQGSDKSNSYP